MISRWAPDSENDTTLYATYVAKKMGISMHDSVKLQKLQDWLPLVTAIIGYENGKQPYDRGTLECGILAGMYSE
jgi:hypothetical protein